MGLPCVGFRGDCRLPESEKESSAPLKGLWESGSTADQTAVSALMPIQFWEMQVDVQQGTTHLIKFGRHLSGCRKLCFVNQEREMGKDQPG